MQHAAKVLLIALDAAEPSLLRRWAAEGRLPNIARLIGDDSSSDLISPAAEFPDEVWPSIFTSSSAAQLGKYYYIQPRRGGYELEMIDDKPRGRQFWAIASEAGRRVLVVDVPKTGLGPRVNGSQLVAWGAHATRCEKQSWPPELYGDVLRRHGPHPLFSCDALGRAPADYRRLTRLLIEGVAARGRVIRDLMSRQDWDLCFCAFSETHSAGHRMWHLQDPNNPGYDPDDRHGLRDSLQRTFEAIDREVGLLLDAAGEDAVALVFSGHGMGPQYHGRDLLPALLEMWGLNGDANVEPHPESEIRVDVRKDVVQRLKEAVPIRLQYAVKSMLPEKLERAAICRVMGSKSLNPSARLNSVPNNELAPAFRVNLKGRDEQGRIEPGAEQESILAFLEQRLRELVDPETGLPSISNVTRIAEVYRGELLDVLPDLTAFWSPRAPIHAVHSPGYGTVHGSHSDLRTGGHAPKGFLAVRAPGRPLDLSSAPPSGKDVAPTVLDLLGVAVPSEMEGRSWLVGSPAVAAAD